VQGVDWHVSPLSALIFNVNKDNIAHLLITLWAFQVQYSKQSVISCKYIFCYNKTKYIHQFPKFTPARNSTYFGQFFCPSSGVYSMYTRHWYMSYRFETCRFSCRSKFGKLVHLVGFIMKKFFTMNGHMNVKFVNIKQAKEI
jgi:hypothetical protein